MMMLRTKDFVCRLLVAGGVFAAASLSAAPVLAQKAFPSAEAAADALVDAIATSDPDATRVVLGSDWNLFIPTDGVDEDDKLAFLGAWAKKHEIVQDSETLAHLSVGEVGWILPIPITKKGDVWRFDTQAAADEIRTRQIGRNELDAMQAVLAYHDAQLEYALEDRNGDGVREYAQRLVSTPGKQDGLYWAVLPGEPESPLGPFFDEEERGAGYHGYYYKIIKAQGPNAPGGAYDYVIGGRLTGGFALVAWPVRYDDTGVMTFIVNHDGQLYQRDLGPGTSAAARAMKRFDPDSDWTEITP